MQEIIRATDTVSTTPENLFERGSAVGYLGYLGLMEYAQKLYPALRNRMPETYLAELNRSSRKFPGAPNREYVQWQRGPLSDTPLVLMESGSTPA